MRALPAFGLALLCAACAGTPPPPPPDPVPPAPAPERPGIETSAVAPATVAAVPLMPAVAAAPQAQGDLPPSLTRTQIEKTFTHHRRFFNEAYRQRLQARPRLAGTLQVAFTILPDGSTTGVRKFSSTLNDPPFEQAVLDQITRMNFPPAAGQTPVDRYPLQFSERTQP